LTEPRPSLSARGYPRSFDLAEGSPHRSGSPGSMPRPKVQSTKHSNAEVPLDLPGIERPAGAGPRRAAPQGCPGSGIPGGRSAAELLLPHQDRRAHGVFVSFAGVDFTTASRRSRALHRLVPPTSRCSPGATTGCGDVQVVGLARGARPLRIRAEGGSPRPLGHPRASGQRWLAATVNRRERVTALALQCPFAGSVVTGRSEWPGESWPDHPYRGGG
jgi:hypothetical protein